MTLPNIVVQRYFDYVQLITCPFLGPSKADPSTPSVFSGASSADPAVIEKDNSFRQFRRLCADIAEENSYTGKTNLVATYLKKGNGGGKMYMHFVRYFIF